MERQIEIINTSISCMHGHGVCLSFTVSMSSLFFDISV